MPEIEIGLSTQHYNNRLGNILHDTCTNNTRRGLLNSTNPVPLQTDCIGESKKMLLFIVR